MKNASILIVEDERIVAEDIKLSLETMGYNIHGIVNSGKAAIDILILKNPDLILMDIKLQGNMTGIETADYIRHRYDIPLIYITANSNNSIVAEAKKTEPYGFIQKPFDDRDLDITIDLALYKHKMEQEKKRSSNLYQSLFHQSHTGIHLADKSDRIIDVNDAFCTMMEYSREELLNMTVSDLQAPEVRGEKGKVVLKEQENFGTGSFEAVNISRSGKPIPVEIQISPILSEDEVLYFSIVKDITDRKEYEISLRRSLKEKEVLLRELYHRTKNNMQVISALLNLQSSYTDNKNVHRIFSKLSDRIQAMALVHHKLYQSKDLSSINFKEYIECLIEHLHQSYIESADRIEIQLEIEDISVMLDAAIPCGLILNEVISNSLRYAFPDQMKGIIIIKMRSEKDKTIRITVKDNGIGIDPETDIDEPKTLGMQLIHTIAEHQLHGEMSYRIVNGTEWTLVFNKNFTSPRV